ncbi:MAG: HD domain-containing protein [Patescibacteria group bacterium]
MKKIWEIFPNLAAVVRKTHLDEKITGGGHDFEHAARVAQYAYIVSEGEVFRNLAGAAGLCHNADRVLQTRLKVGRRDVSADKIRDLVLEWLSSESAFIDSDKETIIDAVLKHGGKNDDSDSPILVALMDADRLVNIELDLVIRSGQFQPDLPAVDFVFFLSDPTADYKNPKSVLRDIFHSLEWETDSRFQIRLPRAVEMAKSRFAALRTFIQTIELQLKDSGLMPYPFV